MCHDMNSLFSSLIKYLSPSVQMGRDRRPSMGGESSRRTKARHDPNPPRYVEESEEEEVEEVPEPQPRGRRGGRRPIKEPAQSQYAPHPQLPQRQAPYMMGSMLFPRPTARSNPRARGVAKNSGPSISGI
jgi:hypothetical protein